MSERALAAWTYDTLISVHGELTSIRPPRSRFSRILRSIPSGRSEIDHALYPEQSMQVDGLDLRDIDYLDSESHLSCPICHITFIDPVSVQCGHYFCAECLVKYWTTAQRPGDRLPCPACRTTVTNTASAPRVVINMCNDMKVKCPSDNCGKIVARGDLQTHLTQYCMERVISCPDHGCKEKVKRKHYVLGLCRHATHTECTCGDLVLSEEMGTHRQVDCSLRQVECLHCQRLITHSDREPHECEPKEHCSGQEFGCDVYLAPSALEAHVKTCTMAKMTPYLKTHVANSLAPLQEELSRSQQRVKGLEEGIDKLFEAIESATQELQQSRRGAPHPASHPASNCASSSNAAQPAISNQPPTGLSALSPSTTTTTEPSLRASHRHLLALHENLRTIVTDLSLNHNHLSRRVEQGDAHNSMVCINDRLRLEEQLSVMSNALFSTRAQVQWLLNRERTLGAAVGQQQQQQAAMRGRALAATVVGQAQTAEPGAGANGSGNGNANGNEYPAGTGPGIAGPPLRPARRTSGGSQERVKL